MDNIIKNLIDKKENYNDFIIEEIYNALNENRNENLTEKELEKINKYRKNIFLIYEAINILNKIED